MPTKRYALELNQPERLEVSWNRDWKQLAITLDGETVGEFETKKELRAGREFPLPDGSMLHVEFAQGLFAPGLRLVRNGVPLPGSASAPDPGAEPQSRLATAYHLTFFIGCLSALMGLIAVVFRVEFRLPMDFGLGLLVYGGLSVLLGYLVKRRSLVALVMAIALTVLLAIVWSMNRNLSGGAMHVITLITPIIIMIQAIPAIRSLKTTQG